MHHLCPPPIWTGRSAIFRHFLPLSALRLSRAALVSATSALVLSACSSFEAPSQTSTERNFERRLYVGGGVLISQLDPGVQQFDGLTVDEDRGFGASFGLGYDVTRRLAIEGHFASLGEANLDPEGDISYQVGGLSALIYGINEPRDRAMREGLSFFGRAGLGTLNSDSDLPVERLNDVHLVLGAGIEYGLSNGLAGRLELVSHDSDAAFGQMGLVYRFGANGNGNRTRRPAAAASATKPSVSDAGKEPEVASNLEIDSSASAPSVLVSPTFREVLKPDRKAIAANSRSAAPASGEGLVIQPRDRVTDSAAAGLLVTRRPVDDDNDGVGDAADVCPDTREGRPVDERGCDLFDGVVEGVTFQIASNRLTESALIVLAEVAKALEDYPDIRVSIDAHTDNRGNTQSNLLLSKRRALEVTRYLVAQGIAGNRLKPNAYGEKRPVDSNETSDGRRRNRRVEFRVLE